MQTLQKPKGAEEVESRKSSTCQPGRVSIKYSDMLLVWLVEAEFLGWIGGCGIFARGTSTEFLIKG
jgi:hypothetical protein